MKIFTHPITRNEKPLPIIAATQECIKTALKIQPKDLKSK